MEAENTIGLTDGSELLTFSKKQTMFCTFDIYKLLEIASSISKLTVLDGNYLIMFCYGYGFIMFVNNVFLVSVSC